MGALAGEIVINRISAIDSIKKFSFQHYPNQHPRANICAYLKKDADIEKVFENLENKIVSVLYKKDEKEKKIFTGYVENTKIVQQGLEYYELNLELIGVSSVLDFEKKEKSFQNTENTHRQIVDKVLHDTYNPPIVWKDNKEQKIGMPVMQYKETDWEFIKRMVSIYHIPVITNLTSEKVVLSAGVSGKEAGNLEMKHYRIGVSKKYYELGGSACGLSKKLFRYYRVETKKMFRLGDRIEFNGETCYISGVEALLKGAELIYTYTIGSKALFYIKTISNRKLIGQTILGTVLETKKETLKLDLHLKQDEHKKEEAYSYDWKPESGNLLYCMPKKGTKVSLYFGDSNEASAIVVNCIRTNGKTSKYMDNPKEKYFTTEDGLSMKLKMDEIDFTVPKEGIEHAEDIKEEDIFSRIQMQGDILYFVTEGGIKLQAKKEISFSESQFFFGGVYKDSLCVGKRSNSFYDDGVDSYIRLCYQFDVKSKNVFINMFKRNQYELIDEQLEENDYSVSETVISAVIVIAGAGVATSIFAVGPIAVGKILVKVGLMAGGSELTLGGLESIILTAARGGVACASFQGISMGISDYMNKENTDFSMYVKRCVMQYGTGAVFGGLGAKGMVLESEPLFAEIIGNSTSQVADNWVSGKSKEELFDGVLEAGTSSYVMFGLVQGVGKWKGLSDKTGLNKLNRLVEMEGIENQSILLKEEKESVEAVIDLNQKAMTTTKEMESIYHNKVNISKKERVKLAEESGKALKKEKQAIKEAKKITKKNQKSLEKQLNTLNEVLSKVNTRKHNLQFSWGYQEAELKRTMSETYMMSGGSNIFTSLLGMAEKENRGLQFNLNSYESYVQQQEIKEQLRRNGKVTELNESCNFTGWIEEGQMLKVYAEDLDKIIRKIKDIFGMK